MDDLSLDFSMAYDSRPERKMPEEENDGDKQRKRQNQKNYRNRRKEERETMINKINGLEYENNKLKEEL